MPGDHWRVDLLRYARYREYRASRIHHPRLLRGVRRECLARVDPILASIVLMPAFYALGAGIYQIYHVSFERRGDQSLRGLAFFFGLLFITEVVLVLVFGVDYRLVEARYIGPSIHLGDIELPLRLLVPCLVSLGLIAILQVFLKRTFVGRAILAVAQDQMALRLMAADPVRIKRIAFALSIATASVAGAILIVIQPIDPSLGREYIGRVFAICVLGGLGSFAGTVIAAMTLGTVESLTATFYGPSWAPAVAFGLLLIALAVRPTGSSGADARASLRPYPGHGRDAGLCGSACDRQQLCVFRRLRGAAIHRAGNRLEHSGWILRLCEFRHGGLLCRRAWTTVVLYKLRPCRFPR